MCAVTTGWQQLDEWSDCACRTSRLVLLSNPALWCSLHDDGGFLGNPLWCNYGIVLHFFTKTFQLCFIITSVSLEIRTDAISISTISLRQWAGKHVEIQSRRIMQSCMSALLFPSPQLLSFRHAPFSELACQPIGLSSSTFHRLWCKVSESQRRNQTCETSKEFKLFTRLYLLLMESMRVL